VLAPATDEEYQISVVRSGDLAPPDCDAMVDMWVEALQSAAAVASNPALSRLAQAALGTILQQASDWSWRNQKLLVNIFPLLCTHQGALKQLVTDTRGDDVVEHGRVLPKCPVALV
jgi:hypothetical protein